MPFDAERCPTLMSEKRIRSVRLKQFKDLSDKLPKNIQEIADEMFKVFKANPSEPRLETKELAHSSRSRHRANSYRVALTYRYRAI